MSLLTRRIFSIIRLKDILKHRDSILIKTQCYSCLSSSGSLKFQKFCRQQISCMKEVRELNFGFRTAQNVILKTFDNLVFKNKYKQKHIGFLWYQTMDEVNVEEFFTLLELPDTYYNWFKVIELHVWMLLLRMNQDGHELRYIREGLMEAMWMDMEKRAKMVDKLNRNFTKNFKLFYNDFSQQALFWYDYGYFEGDIALTNMVWSVFFDRMSDDPEKLEAVVRFIRCQIKHLQTIDTKALDENEKTGVWTPLKPHVNQLLLS